MLLSSIRSLNPAILCSRLTFRWLTLTRVRIMPRWTFSPKWWRIRFDTIFCHLLRLNCFFTQICAGFLDPNWSLSTGLCRYDSGSSLSIPQIVDGEKRYYLQGVASNTLRSMDCYTSYYTLFTNVQYYRNLINKALRKSKKF